MKISVHGKTEEFLKFGFLEKNSDFRIQIVNSERIQIVRNSWQLWYSHKQTNGGSIVLWRTFSWASLGLLVEVKKTLNDTGYLYIIAYQLQHTGHLSFQQEMECSNRTRLHVTSLELCWSGSRNVMLNSS